MNTQVKYLGAAFALLLLISPLVHARPAHHPHKATLHHAIEKVEHAHRWCDKHPERCAKQRVLHRTWCDTHPVECKARREQRQTWCATHPTECADKRASDGSWDLDLEDVGE